MSSQAPRGRTEPILIDEATHTFPGGLAPGWPAGKRAKGTLILTSEALLFDPGQGTPPLEIPIDEIDGLTVIRRHPLAGANAALLRITYRTNLVLGVSLARPEVWINAIEALHRRGKSIRVERRDSPMSETRPYRAIVISFLLLVLLLSIALPLFFSWMHGRSQNVGRSADRSAVSGG